MVRRLIQAAARGWLRPKGADPMVIDGATFIDGVIEIDATDRAA